jgi:hypothetical protein
MAATPFLVPHMLVRDLSAAFSLRHASASTGMLPARARAEEGLNFQILAHQTALLLAQIQENRLHVP